MRRRFVWFPMPFFLRLLALRRNPFVCPTGLQHIIYRATYMSLCRRSGGRWTLRRFPAEATRALRGVTASPGSAVLSWNKPFCCLIRVSFFPHWTHVAGVHCIGTKSVNLENPPGGLLSMFRARKKKTTFPCSFEVNLKL